MSDYVGSFLHLGRAVEKLAEAAEKLPPPEAGVREPERPRWPNPSVSQLRQAVTEFCVWPLGEQGLKDHYSAVRSVLLTGAKGSGKRTLANAIATETGAAFFDLTPSNTNGKYGGKKGPYEMVFATLKLAKAYQPAVVWIGDIEVSPPLRAGRLRTLSEACKGGWERKGMPLRFALLAGHMHCAMPACLSLYHETLGTPPCASVTAAFTLLAAVSCTATRAGLTVHSSLTLRHVCQLHAQSIFNTAKPKKGAKKLPKPPGPKPDKPKRILKPLKTLVYHKSDKKRILAPTDRVLIIGSSDMPYVCEKAKDYNKLVGFFQKIFYLPLPDYPSRVMLWQEALKRQGVPRPPADDVQTLARISEHYSSGSIIRVVRKTLTQRRVERLERKPLTANELIGPLAKETPIYAADDKAMYDWYIKTLGLNKKSEADPGAKGKKDAGKPGAKKK